MNPRREPLIVDCDGHDFKDREGRGSPWSDKTILPASLALFVLGIEMSDEMARELDAVYRLGEGTAVIARLAKWFEVSEAARSA